jgi:lipoate-protein ligase A
MQLGRVMNPQAKLYLQLCGDSGDSSKIVLRPTGGPTDTFQEGKVYKFSVEMPSVGKVTTEPLESLRHKIPLIHLIGGYGNQKIFSIWQKIFKPVARKLNLSRVN